MISYSIRFLLVLAMVQLVIAEGAPTTTAPVSPTVDLMSSSFEGDGNSALNVQQLSAPDSRLKYVDVGNLVTQNAGGDLYPASTSDGSTGMTSFDGTNITVNVPQDQPTPDCGPVRVQAVSSSISGSWAAPRTGHARSTMAADKPALTAAHLGHSQVGGRWVPSTTDRGVGTATGSNVEV